VGADPTFVLSVDGPEIILFKMLDAGLEGSGFELFPKVFACEVFMII
jgi:hypothetical protein